MNKFFLFVSDAALLAALVFGNEDSRTFAFWFYCVITVVMYAGAVFMPAVLKETLIARSKSRRAYKRCVVLLTIAALVYAGFPVLAVFFLFGLVAVSGAIKSDDKKAVA